MSGENYAIRNVYQIDFVLQPLTQRCRPRLQTMYLLGQKEQILLILKADHAIPLGRPSITVIIFRFPGYLCLDQPVQRMLSDV